MESAGVWLVKFGDLEISSISSFETWGWRKTGLVTGFRGEYGF